MECECTMAEARTAECGWGACGPKTATLPTDDRGGPPSAGKPGPRRAAPRADSLLRENRKLADANRRLRRIDTFKSEFLSVASHELRTPLTIIKEFVGVLRDGLSGPINADQKECLDSAYRNCIRLAELIDDLLDLQKIESGRLRLRRARVVLAPVLERCHRDFLPRFEAKSQRLVLVPHPEPLEVLADEAKVIGVLINLLGNAHKFTPAGGTVVLRAFREGSEAVVEVTDSGPGITPEDQHLLFEKFTQVGREEGPGMKGTGLGLAIARSVVELHGGRIGVRSAPGDGSTFAFSLPLHRGEDELRVRLGDRMAEAGAQGQKLHLMLFQPEADGEGRPAGEEAVSWLAAAAARVCRWRDDEVVAIPGDGLLAIFTNTAALGPQAILSRLLEALRQEGKPIAAILHASVRIVPDGRPERWIEIVKSRFRRVDVDLSGRTILVVRDDEEGIDALSASLMRNLPGVRTFAARNGCDAFVLLGKIAPDVVVVDLRSESCNSEKILRHIRKAPDLARRPRVIAVSGDGDPPDEEMRRWGADVCLRRPLDMDALVREAELLLKERGAPASPVA